MAESKSMQDLPIKTDTDFSTMTFTEEKSIASSSKIEESNDKITDDQFFDDFFSE